MDIREIFCIFVISNNQKHIIMYKKIEILISPKELLVVTLRIDNILNAYNQFHIDINLYQTRKTPEPQYTFNGKLYWGLKDYSREEWQSKAITAIPQLATLLPLVNCDTFGIDTHIISNGFYFLKNQEYNALKENYRFKKLNDRCFKRSCCICRYFK